VAEQQLDLLKLAARAALHNFAQVRRLCRMRHKRRYAESRTMPNLRCARLCNRRAAVNDSA
jgi:hypothetical protein